MNRWGTMAHTHGSIKHRVAEPLNWICFSSATNRQKSSPKLGRCVHWYYVSPPLWPEICEVLEKKRWIITNGESPFLFGYSGPSFKPTRGCFPLTHPPLALDLHLYRISHASLLCSEIPVIFPEIWPKRCWQISEADLWQWHTFCGTCVTCVPFNLPLG